jgi:hypothetical protein
VNLSFAATPIMIALPAAPLGNAGFYLFLYLFLTVAFGWIATIASRLRHPLTHTPVATKRSS